MARKATVGRQPKAQAAAKEAPAKAGARALPESYFDLVRGFPLVAIADDGELDRAQEVAEDLLARDRDAGEEAYLDVLSTLIESYEEEHYPIPDAPAGDVLRLMMESHGLTQRALAEKVGIVQSTISAILGGKRKPTAEHIAALSRAFNVPPSVFFKAGAE